MSLLVTVTGPDHPGVTAGLFDALAGTAFSDVEQVVVHGRLLLGFVLEDDTAELRSRVSGAALDLAVDVSFTPLDDEDEQAATKQHHVTVHGRQTSIFGM